jgi:sugar lactone lactonase YvrE
MRRFTIFSALLISASLLALPALAQQDIITTAIGGGPNDILAVQADLYDPAAVSVDSAGNYYIAAYDQNRVFKVNTSGVLTVVAGLGVAGYAGDKVSGGAGNALLNAPLGVAADGAGNVYIADYANYVIRKVSASNTITTIAGIAGSCAYNGDGSPATSFELCHPTGIALDSTGANLYIADTGNCRIRKLVLATGAISTYAGTGSCTYVADGVAATTAPVNQPNGVAVDGLNNVYIADTNNYRIRLVTKSTGLISTIAGDGTYGYSGDTGPATTAEITHVYDGIAVNSAGTTVTIGDYNNYRVRQFTVGGNINTIAGTGTPGFFGDTGLATSAEFNGPYGVAVTSSGGVYVADNNNDRIRFFTVGGDISTVAGNGGNKFPTLVSGVAPQGVVFNDPLAVLEDPSKNVFVSDYLDYMVRELVQSTDLVDFYAGDGVRGYTGSGTPATAAELDYPNGLARDSAGNVYIADTANCVIRKVDTSNPPNITTFAGTSVCGYSGDGGPAASAKLNQPAGVWVDSHNNVYIADTNNFIVRKVTAGGTISTVAGTPGTQGYLGDGDPATAAELRYPSAVSLDGAGNLYIADTNNCVIREVSAATGKIETVVGTGTCGYTGDGLAIENRLYYPNDVLADANGHLFIVDTYNHIVRWVDPSGNMTTFAGTPQTAGLSGDGGDATLAELYYPAGVSRDGAGNFLVADEDNLRIRGVSAFAALGVSSTDLSFGLITVGATSAPQTVTLSALGPLTIGNISTTGAFSEADDCGTSLANGTTCTVYVFFKPTVGGAATGSLTIADNGYFNSSTTITLEGTGTAISVTGGPLVFGSEAVKTTSAAKKITVTNKGATSITMGTIKLDETADFAISANTCPASGSPLAAAASCSVSVTFTPQTTGAKKGALIVNDSDQSSPQFAGMTGTGTSTVAFKPSSVTFATEAIGVTSTPTKITLTNNTGAKLTLGNPAVSFTGPFASAHATTCTPGLPIAVGGTCSIFVTFTPTAVGDVTGTLTVTDSDASSPQTVPLAGVGTGVEFTPASVNFGTSNVGVRVQSTVTITNVSGSPITFTAWTTTGPNAADFNATAVGNPPCRGSLAAGAICTFTIYFTPSVAAAESASFNIYDNSPGSPQVLPLTGTGQ